MSETKTIQDKIKDLRSIGFFIEEKGSNYTVFFEKKNANNPFWVTWCGPQPEDANVYTERELAKKWKTYFGKGVKWKKIVKESSRGMDRAAQRDLIKTEQYEKIPSNKRVKLEDPWAWD